LTSIFQIFTTVAEVFGPFVALVAIAAARIKQTDIGIRMQANLKFSLTILLMRFIAFILLIFGAPTARRIVLKLEGRITANVSARDLNDALLDNILCTEHEALSVS
jgi:hypothetical protein